MPENAKPAMQEAPFLTGTVTFLFTDIEGSTKLLEGLREQYATLLEEQRDLLRAGFERWNGHEIDTQGDAFFVAFPRALDAVQCVIEAQRELSAHTWPGGVRVRVRMGLHTGEPIVGKTGYVGMDVHRAARIAHAAHGGQVLLSQATHALVYQDLPAGASLQDLGEHKLKDIRFAQRIYQLDIASLPGEFPALKTLSTEEAPPAPGEAPYKGLQFFDEADTSWFFGRQGVTIRLLAAVQDQRFLAVIGASGSGKSSVVRAGLIPALKRPLTGSQPVNWQVQIFTPGAHPLEALAVCLTKDADSASATAALIDDLRLEPRSLHLFLRKLVEKAAASRGSDAGRGRSETGILEPRQVLLVIDQFEELFTQCRDEGERQAFIDNLLYAVQAEGGRLPLLRIVITLRADFYEHVARYAELREVVAAHQIYIGAMNAEELRQAIEAPAQHGGWEISPGLVDLMLHDVGAASGRQPEPGALPLLSHALLETWKRRRGNLLNLRAYTEAGGVRGAIAHTADSVYNLELNADQQAIARDIFLRLTELGEGAEDTRRRISIHELIPTGPAGNPEQVEAVLIKLADARLITTSAGTVEVAHEALIREWPTLREWLAQDREGLRLHRHLTEAAQEWELMEYDPGSLYRGARLAQAVEWALANPRQLNAQEGAFLEAARQFAEREMAEQEEQRQRELDAAHKLAEAERQRAEEQTRSAQRLRQRAFYLIAALILALGLAAAAIYFARTSNQNAEMAANGQAEAELQAELAATNAVQARQQQALAEEQSRGRATQQAIAENERSMAEQRALEAYARELSQAAEANQERDPELSMLLSLEAISITQAAGEPVSLELQDILHRAVQASRARLTIEFPGGAWGLDISPDGRLLASAGIDGRVRLFDAANGQPAGELTGHSAAVGDVAFSPDGQSLASFSDDGTARIWDLASADEEHPADEIHPSEARLILSGHGGSAYYTAFSPLGNQLATVDNQDVVRIWDVSSGTGAGQLVLTLPGQTGNIAFSPDGQRLATTTIADGRTRVWDLSSGQEQLALPYEYWGTALAFSPDGKRLVAEGPEVGMLTIFDARGDTPTTGEPLASLCCHSAAVVTIDFNPDGTHLATAGAEGVAKVWDANSGRELFTLSGRMGPVDDLVFSPECTEAPSAPFAGCGRYIYTSSREGTIKKWDVSPAGNSDLFTTQGALATWSSDGKLMEVIDMSQPERVRIHSWEVLTGGGFKALGVTQLPLLPGIIVTGDSVYSLTGMHSVIVSEDGSLQAWEVGHPEDVISYSVPISNTEVPVGVFILPGGLRLATHLEGDNTRIWDVESGQVLLELPAEGMVSISPNGSLIAIGSPDGQVSLWDGADGKPLLSIPAHPLELTGLTFSPDSKRLVTGSLDTNARVWDVATGRELDILSHKLSVFEPTFSRDGRRLAVNQPDGSLYIWDVDPDSPKAGQLLFRFTGLDEFAAFNGFSPDGRTVFVGGYFGQQLRLYSLPLEDLVPVAEQRLTRTWAEAECQKYLHTAVCPTGSK